MLSCVEIVGKPEDWEDFSKVRTLSSLFSNLPMRLHKLLAGKLIQIWKGNSRLRCFRFSALANNRPLRVATQLQTNASVVC